MLTLDELNKIGEPQASMAKACFAFLEPMLDKIHDAAVSAPVDKSGRVLLAASIAAHGFALLTAALADYDDLHPDAASEEILKRYAELSTKLILDCMEGEADGIGNPLGAA